MVGLPNPFRAPSTRARAASSIAASGSASFANALTEALVQLIEEAFDILSRNIGRVVRNAVFSERQVQTASDTDKP